MKPFSLVPINSVTSVTSAPIDLRWAFCFLYDLVWAWSGAAGTGSIVIQYTHDLEVVPSTVWHTYSTTDIATGTSAQVEKLTNPYGWMRVVLTKSTGTLTSCVVNVIGKGV